MIPVLYKFSADSPTVMYLLGFAVVLYSFFSGWRGAHGPLNSKTGEFGPPSRQEQLQRALLYGVIGIALVGVGLHYAMPSTFFGKGKGEGIPIHTYGILVGGGFLAAVTVAAYLAEREWLGEEGLRKRDQIFDLAFWVFVGAMVGSRVLFIVVNWKQYAANPSSIFDLGGGLVFYGGLIGAALVAFFYARKHGIDFLRLADIAMPTVSLGQCLGRLGCFSAGCCWGRVAHAGSELAVRFPGLRYVKNIFGGLGDTASLAYQTQVQDGRWVVEATGKVFDQRVPDAVRISDWVAAHGHTLPVHPTQLYESVGQLLLFVALLTLRRYRRFHGQIFGAWLMCYAVLRSTIELFRGDVERGTLHGLVQQVPLEAWYNISTSQFISVCMFALGASVIVARARKLGGRAAAALRSLTEAPRPG